MPIRSYWCRVVNQASHEAGALVRMTSRPRFYALLATILVASVIAPILAGEYGLNELMSNWFWIAIWSAAVAVVFVPIFIWKLFSVPAKMHSELEAKFTAQSVPLAFRATDRHQDIITKLSAREAQLLLETVGGRRLTLRYADALLAKGWLVAIENGRVMGGFDITTLKMWGQESVAALYGLRDKKLLVCTGTSGVCPLTEDGEIVAALIASGGLSMDAKLPSVSCTPSDPTPRAE